MITIIHITLIITSYIMIVAIIIISAFPLVGASNVGGFLCRCDPRTQTLFVFRYYYKHQIVIPKSPRTFEARTRGDARIIIIVTL